MKNKILLTLLLCFVFALALVIVSSAEGVYFCDNQTALNSAYSSTATNGNNTAVQVVQTTNGFVDYGDVSSDFVCVAYVVLIRSSNTTASINYISDVEAFQNRYKGYSYTEYEAELISQLQSGVVGLASMLEIRENAFAYFMNYIPKDKLIQIYESEINTLESEIVRLQEYNNVLNGAVLDLEKQVEIERQKGYNDGLQDGEALPRGLGVILSAPMYILNGVFGDVEILGFNLFNVIMTILSVLVVAFVIKKLAN